MDIKETKLGFTLVELSIVLVIISLIVGGIVSGRSLIKSAELRAISDEFNMILTAINTFQLQYDALPGDMRDASNYWSVASDGDGNQFIENGEIYQAWLHLSLAEIVPGNFTGTLIGGNAVVGENAYASDKNGGGYFIRSVLPTFGRTGNLIELGTWTSADAILLTGPILSAQQTKSIDKKMDDGIANNGSLYGVNADAVTGCSADWNHATGADYQLSNTNISCRLMLWLN